MSATNLITVTLGSVVLLLMAAFTTNTALDLVTVTAPGGHVVRLATLGSLTHCVTSSSATINYALQVTRAHRRLYSRASPPSVCHGVCRGVCYSAASAANLRAHRCLYSTEASWCHFVIFFLFGLPTLKLVKSTLKLVKSTLKLKKSTLMSIKSTLKWVKSTLKLVKSTF